MTTSERRDWMEYCDSRHAPPSKRFVAYLEWCERQREHARKRQMDAATRRTRKAKR